ncbi:GSCOCG00002529001-RA-CDS, partial [Cotesia congregata]
VLGIKCTGCGYPGAPAHSTVRFTDNLDDVLDEEDSLIKDTVFPTGTVATYACERGFELLGPARRQCQPDGTWTPEGVPFCVRIYLIYLYMERERERGENMRHNKTKGYGR